MQVSLYMAVSADGFISNRDEETPWSDEEWAAYKSAVEEAGCLVIGRNTYEAMKDDGSLNELGISRIIVLSSKEIDGVESIDSAEAAINTLEQDGFKEVVVAGGAKTNGAFLKAGLIDELILDIESFVFGEGIPLFAGEDLSELKLDLIESKQLGPQTIRVHYKVLN